jgi:hypothetical protein
MSSKRMYWTMRAIWNEFLCFLIGHDWDYFSLTNLDGTPAHFRCCLRCELSQELFDDNE